MLEDPGRSFPWALWSAGVVQKQVGTSYSIIVMYLPGTWAYARGEFSGFKTDDTGTLWTFLYSITLKYEMRHKTSQFCRALGDFQSRM